VYWWWLVAGERCSKQRTCQLIGFAERPSWLTTVPDGVDIYAFTGWCYLVCYHLLFGAAVLVALFTIRLVTFCWVTLYDNDVC